MYLKSLTLKGFKSFAAPTTLRFEPGITAVVGPNGSGKSNVVDALAWVMGEQGAKTLRGGKMEDVIFAGTSSRAPLGRAEVTVSIDNSDNALPIEYTEVSITRRMFRDGASEYEINGSSCRLMDVQELLSDSGIGREMHVIVGQGKLEEILQSRPEDRRAFIEEAAGVLKHRKRKEKALRKLDTMAANLARLTDLTTELRRQLKPLGRQAEAAQRAAAIQADLRDARLRLAADDLVSRRAEREAVFQAEAAMRREHDEAAARLAVASEELAAHESAVAELSTRAESIQHTWFGLSALAERVDATVRIASERAHHLDIEPVAVSDTDPRKPEELEAEAQQVAVAEQQLLAELDAALAGALTEQSARQDAAEQALAALNESDTAISAMYEQLGRLGQEARAAEEEWNRLLQQRTEQEAVRTQTLDDVIQLETQLRKAQETQRVQVAQPIDRQAISAAADRARGVEVEARLAVRTAEERANAVRGRADSLRRAAAAEREARVRAQQARAARLHAAAVAAAVADCGRLLAGRLHRAVDGASQLRDASAAQRQQRLAAMAAVRDEVNTLSARVGELTDSLHRDELANAQAALRIEQLEQMVLEQFGMAPADLITEYGPHVALPPTELEMAEFEQARERGEQVIAPAPMPFDRVTQERRAKRAERALAELGRVNPLALEEFAALEERYNFLSTQLEDVKAARKDLLGVVADVDARILQVFNDAFVDVEREFRGVFTALFPGGEGRLRLTEPDDMLTTGIEVEARPPGKKITRLSLLSGGEKALTAVAMLVAIFRARPSPFYIMDEVEAALDDVNLRRLLSLFEQLREQSQIIIITHQKPTMEVADALYGVTMQNDGITAVISQRMRGQQVDQLVTNSS